MQITEAHNTTPAYRVETEQTWRRSGFNVSLVAPEGHITFFYNVDRPTAIRIAGELTLCSTYGEQRATVESLRARLFV